MQLCISLPENREYNVSAAVCISLPENREYVMTGQRYDYYAGWNSFARKHSDY